MVAQAVAAAVMFAVLGYAAYKYTDDKFNKQKEGDLVLPNVVMVLVVSVLFIIVTYARYKNEKKKYKQEVIIWF